MNTNNVRQLDSAPSNHANNVSDDDLEQIAALQRSLVIPHITTVKEANAWIAKCDAEKTRWAELVSTLGFAEVEEFVTYAISTFRSEQEASNYLVELLGIPAARVEHIGTRLFAPASAAATPKYMEGMVLRPTAVNSRLKLSKKSKKGAGKAAELLNNAFIINWCGRIEYNGAPSTIRSCTTGQTQPRQTKPHSSTWRSWCSSTRRALSACVCSMPISRFTMKTRRTAPQGGRKQQQQQQG
ncbi:hypothetical protein PR002_g15293 [Phytophthora rubi]|uniref:Uncharacterized protein n=1 Tax=Phytophthora rubi TaxID=129364 RepID=A0A6A3KTG1_9STRA|nr:hypothetical protein PR002_g15293 [Phytophthora rubi]